MSRINCETLVSLVRARAPLYDYSHPAHCNRDVTSSMWSEIAAELGTSGSIKSICTKQLGSCRWVEIAVDMFEDWESWSQSCVRFSSSVCSQLPVKTAAVKRHPVEQLKVICKTKWANLRSNFVRELRRIRPAEDGTMWPPQWPLFKPLMFLVPFLKKRSSNGTPAEEAVLHLDFSDQRSPSVNNKVEVRIPAKRPRYERVTAEEEKDDDKLFMLSLVPKMRQLSTIDNVSFRIEVQQLLLNKLCQSSQQSSEHQAVEVLIEDLTDCYEEVIIKDEDGTLVALNSNK